MSSFCTFVLEKTLESPLDSKEIKLDSPKGNQHWIFIGRTDAETEAPILWPLDVKVWLTEKDLDPGNNWRQKKRGQQTVVWLDSSTDSMDMNSSKFQEIVEDWGAWHAAVHGVSKSQTWLSYWTTRWIFFCFFSEHIKVLFMLYSVKHAIALCLK